MAKGGGVEGREARREILVTMLGQDDRATVRQQQRVQGIARNPK